jgi:hypothetical protein
MSFLTDLEKKYDTNGDGKVTYEEVKALYLALPVKTMMCVAFGAGALVSFIVFKIVL